MGAPCFLKRQERANVTPRVHTATTRRSGSRTRDSGAGGSVDPGGYIGAVTRMGVRFRGVSVTDVAMPVRAVCKTSLSWPQKEAL